MGIIPRETFKQYNKEKDEKTTSSTNDGPRVRFFGLKDDGEEAIVRFVCKSPEEFELLMTHGVKTSDGKFTNVSCLRKDYHDKWANCPLCAAGAKAHTNDYIKMIEYAADENGEIVPTLKIWSRSDSSDVMNSLRDKFEEYGNLENYLFRVKRQGVKGDKQPKYSLVKLNPDLYPEASYPKMPGAFNGYNLLGNAVKVWTFEDMNEYVANNPKSNYQDQNDSNSKQAPKKVEKKEEKEPTLDLTSDDLPF